MTIDAQASASLLDRIPLEAKVVMQVGCGAGALAAAYKRRNPAARFLGVERDPERARQAVAVMDAVACVDVEATPLPFGHEKLDCIVYDRVLDSLRDPAGLLKRQAEALRASGTIVLSVANVEHWRFTERLLRGGWDYDEQDALAPRLRWFSRATMRRALVLAGLHPVEPFADIDDAAGAEAFAHALSPALRQLGIDEAAFLRRSAPRGHVWCARRRPEPQMVVTSTMLVPVGGVSQVRVTDPLRALATNPSVIARVGNHLPPPDGTDGPRVAIFHRPAFAGEQGLRPIRAAMASGHVTVCEFDDHPGYIPILNRPDIYNFSAVHGVQTSTQELADILRRDNPEVVVFPNAVPELPEIRNFRNPGRITMFCAGLNREAEWLSIVPALNAVAATVGERLHFRVVNDRGLFDALRTLHKSFTPLCDYQTYQGLLATSELSCMPLLDNPFNRCKSDLKFIEAAAHRAVSVASAVVYADTVVDGQTGIIFRSADELQEKLLGLIANPAIGCAIGNAARSYVARHRMMAYQVSRRNSWYRSLWERRDALTTALLLRVPELVAPAAELVR